MNKKKWTVGDACVVEVKSYRGARELHDATVVRVGREYMTVVYETTYTPTYAADAQPRTVRHSCEVIMVSGWPRNDRNGHRMGAYRVWVSREAWRTSEVTGLLWARVRDCIHRNHTCPSFLTEEQLRQLATILCINTTDVPEAK